MVTGSTVTIAGNAAVPNGNYVLTSALLSTTFTFAIVEANVSLTAGGTWTDVTPAAADADPVGVWQDQSGNGRNVTQATAGFRPLLKLAVQNGRSVVRFDGTNDFLATATPTLNQPLSIFVVGKLSAAGQVLVDGNAVGAGETAIYTAVAQSNYTMFAGSAADTGTAFDTSYHTLSALFSGTSSFFRKDLSQTGALNPGTGTMAGFVLGAGAAGISLFLNGDLAEVLIYNATLTAGQFSQVDRYLKAKWSTP
jgi:hypothetical protein